MSLAIQQPLPGIEMARREPSTADILQLAMQKDAPIDTVERLVAMMEREREHQSRVAFDDALAACQSEIGRIAPDKQREKGIKWATYEAIDNQIRPIYTRHGFGISFSQENAQGPDRIGVAAYLTRSGISKQYHRDMPVVVPGQTSRADAEEAAYSRAQRYLIKRIFNITVGNDEAESKPYESAATEAQEAQLLEWSDALRQCDDLPMLKNTFADAYKFAASVNPHAKAAMARVYEEQKRRLQ